MMRIMIEINKKTTIDIVILKYIRQYYHQLYANKFLNVEEMYNFLKRLKFLKLIQKLKTNKPLKLKRLTQ